MKIVPTSCRKKEWLRCVQLFVTPWTIACQAPLSMEFYRKEYWSGLPIPSPKDFPNPGIEPRSPALQADSLPSEPPEKPLALYKKGYTEILPEIWPRATCQYTQHVPPYSRAPARITAA